MPSSTTARSASALPGPRAARCVVTYQAGVHKSGTIHYAWCGAPRTNALIGPTGALCPWRSKAVTVYA